MVHRFGKQFPDGVRASIRAEIDRLERLAADLEIVSGLGLFPLDILLARSQPNAPILDEWRLAFRPVVCLEGRATGHPELPGDRRSIVTSEIYLLSEEIGWARSLSRFYRLGRPFNVLSKDS
jgi:hypothetical protein